VTSIWALAAAVALLALRSFAMSHNIGSLAGRTVQDLGHHSTSRSDGSFGSLNTLIENSRSTTVKHLLVVNAGQSAVGVAVDPAAGAGLALQRKAVPSQGGDEFPYACVAEQVE
jgi:hypothetical protein